MKILVIVKEILDTENKVKLNSQNILDERNAKYDVNIYDVYAIEEAIQLKEQYGGEVIIYSVCNNKTVDTFRYIMAMGVDKAILIESDTKDSKTVSELLAQTMKEKHEDFDLILGGWAGIDHNNGQVPGRLSQILGVPLVNVVTKLEVKNDQILCNREGESDHEVVESKIPAIVTVQRGINTPRRPNASNLMESKESKIEIIKSNITKCSDLEISYEYPKPRDEVYMIEETDPKEAAAKLVDKLLEDKVL